MKSRVIKSADTDLPKYESISGTPFQFKDTLVVEIGRTKILKRRNLKLKSTMVDDVMMSKHLAAKISSD